MPTLPPSLVEAMQPVVASATLYLPKALLAVIVLLVGFRLVRVVVDIACRGLKHVDPSLRSFVESMISIGLKALILISVASMVGIQTTSFVAVIGAASLAVGLSLQGSLSNLAGGFLILFFKPFRVGDRIEAQNQKGTVERIELFTTLMRTDEDKIAIIPNGLLSNSVIVNVTRGQPKA
jgi:small conductance mechanosensitive channel